MDETTEKGVKRQVIFGMVVTHGDGYDRVHGVGGTWQPLLLVVGQETQLVAAARGGGSAACYCWLWGGAL